MSTTNTLVRPDPSHNGPIEQDEFIHIPMGMLGGRRKSIDPTGPVWAGALAATGQPERLWANVRRDSLEQHLCH